MRISDALNELATRGNLTTEETKTIFEEIMSGQATNAQIAGILMALRCKGEVVDEITGAAMAMRDVSMKVELDLPYLVDTCGTGGSGSKKLFNVSTASAFVAAAGGAHVAKHGNRGVSSKSGSADLLEEAGVSLDLTADQIARCISEVGVGFMFAQKHHPSMRFAGPVRQELGVRTVFNILGPLTNPAGAKHQVIGVFSDTVQRTLAEVARELGSEHVLVVHSDGLDEISVDGATRIVENKQGQLNEYTVHPTDFGFDEFDVDSLHADTPSESLRLVNDALNNGKNQAAVAIVAMNGGAALYAAGIATDLVKGVALAHDLIVTGQAKEKFKQLVDLSSMMSLA